MRFSQSFIEDLRRQADIVRVISDYIEVKKKGANWMACCPFHGEKTPSFSVSPAKQMYYCFGCQKGGNAISFVMEMERVGFPEAVKIVAEKTGVPLPEPETGARADEQKKLDEARRREINGVIELNNLAVEFWESQLQSEAAEAVFAREYITNRGITDDTRKAFRLSYAPNSWDALLNHLRAKGANDKQLEASGLVVKKDAGGFYDRFRGRVIFPVLDVRGRPVAFGARAIRAGDEPKYLNSSETPVYVKGQHLYGLFQAAAEIKRRKFVILVEGYLDLIALYQAGVTNVVASLGTSLTEAQAKLINRFAHRIVINYDGDKAGRAAARRATEILLTEGFEVKVLVLPDNADPDDFIKTSGVEEYNRRRGASLSHIQFILDEALRERDLNNPAEKAAAVEEVSRVLRAVKNAIARREYFDLAMDTLRIDASLRRELWAATTPDKALYGDSQQKIFNARASNAVEVVSQKIQATVAEQNLLELLAHDSVVRAAFLPQIVATDYEMLATASVFAAMCEMHESGAEFDLQVIAEKTQDDSNAADIVPLLMMNEPTRADDEAPDAALAQAESCLLTLRLMSVDRRLRELGSEIAIAERNEDIDNLHQLVNERLELTRLRPLLVPRTA